MYLSARTISAAIEQLQGASSHLLKIWFVLKHMGLSRNKSVLIDTQNSTPSLQRLFSCGSPDGDLFVPFADTRRFSTMKPDASRSIVQTTIQRWKTSDSVVTGTPSAYLKFDDADGKKIRVSLGRIYPQGLGYGNNGFASQEGARVAIPIEAMAVWLFRQDELKQYVEEGSSDNLSQILTKALTRELNLESSEIEAIFVNKPIEIQTSNDPVSDTELYTVCKSAFENKPDIEIRKETLLEYTQRIQTMTTIDSSPAWTRVAPSEQLAMLVESRESAVLLFGPPRTGKTRAIDQLVPRNNKDRETIQLHEGWGFENLILGLAPGKKPGEFKWTQGPLLRAIKDGKKHIVLEEINRTRISQALGELFSLIEPAYRGDDNGITLPDGNQISIDPEVTFYFTMNNVDTSTEDVDDALMGRLASIYFGPRVEDLDAILLHNNIPSETATSIKKVFTAIQDKYPLGHGYFAGLGPSDDFRMYYLWRIRPVLMNHFSAHDPEVVAQIDNLVDELFVGAE